MNSSVILEVTNDEYELPLNVYDSTRELAERLNTSNANIRNRLSHPPKKKKTKYVRVWLEKGDV